MCVSVAMPSLLQACTLLGGFAGTALLCMACVAVTATLIACVHTQVQKAISLAAIAVPCLCMPSSCVHCIACASRKQALFKKQTKAASCNHETTLALSVRPDNKE